MQPLQIKYSRAAIKFLEKQTRESVKRIRNGIAKLTINPPEGDIAILKGYSDGRKRLRVGMWRIIYRYAMDDQIEIILIIDIGNRGDIYN